MPSDKAQLDTFTMLSDTNAERLKQLLETAPASHESVGITRVKVFYKAAMGVIMIERSGITRL